MVVAVCTAVVLAAGALRVVTADIPAWQRGAWAATGVTVMLVVTAWTLGGPLQAGWAQSASIVAWGHS